MYLYKLNGTLECCFYSPVFWVFFFVLLSLFFTSIVYLNEHLTKITCVPCLLRDFTTTFLLLPNNFRVFYTEATEDDKRLK